MSEDQVLITNLSSLETAVEGLQDTFGGEAIWWRGQACESWDLDAGVFRPLPLGGNYREHALISHFKSRALGMLGHRTKPNSELEWLFLAQHYGLPTRLLDWTESPLVALFFAVQNGKDAHDACLWGISPSHLNKEHSCPAKPSEAQFGLIAFDEKIVRAMAMDAFGFKHEALAQVLGFCPSELPKVIAIETPEIDARIVAQTGRFSLHGSPGALAHFDGSEKYIRKLIVPASAKPWIRQKLEWFGMQTWNLFPDLQSLATALKDHDFSSSTDCA